MNTDRGRVNPLDHWEQTEAILLKFESFRREPILIGDDAPRLKNFVDQIQEAASPALLTELAAIDFEYTYKHSQTATIEPYLRDFPSLAKEPYRTQLIRAELETRKRFGALPDETEISRRLPSHPNLESLIDDVSRSHQNEEQLIPMFQSGTIVDRYQLCECIGMGASAIVYSALERKLKRQVALKFLAKPVAENSAQGLRWLREAQALASVSHPNVLTIFGVGHHEGFDFIASQLVAGESLEKRLATDTISVQHAVSLVSCLAIALEQVHEAGVIHRDIKPANIMLTEGDEPLLVDFGLASIEQTSQPLTQDGDFVGTPAYMPPEQADGRAWQADPRSDIYSLGAVLYRVATGRLPFEGNVSSVVDQVLHHAPVAPRKINPDLPVDLQTIVLKCLEKSPEARYQNAADLFEDLDHFRHNRPIKARPANVATKAVKWAQRRPAVAFLLAVSVLLMIFAAGVFTQLRRVSEQRNRAQLAEAETESLWVQSIVDAGELSMQRGKVKQAIRQFDHAISRSYHDPDYLRLRLIEANLIERDLAAAQKLLDQVNDSSNPRIQFEIEHWRCELSQQPRKQAANQPSEDLIALRSKLLAELSKPNVEQEDEKEDTFAAERRQRLHALIEYSQAQHAPSTDLAIMHYRNALKIDPFQFHARRSLIFCLLTLARFQEAQTELVVALQLFPNSEDLVLLHAIHLAATDQLDIAIARLQETELEAGERDRWKQLCRFAFKLRHRDTISTGSASIDTPKVAAVIEEFLPLSSLFTRRRWKLPEPVIVRMRAFKDQILDRQVSPDSVDRQVVYDLSNCHPEPALKVMAATWRLEDIFVRPSSAARSIAMLEVARDEFRLAIGKESLVQKTDQFAIRGVFATAVKLALVDQHDVEKNQRIFLNALRQLETESIDSAVHVRGITIAALVANDPNQALRWAEHWKEKTGQGTTERVEACWHWCVTQKRRKNWLGVVKGCGEILQIDEDHEMALALKREAIESLKKVIELADQDTSPNSVPLRLNSSPAGRE